MSKKTLEFGLSSIKQKSSYLNSLDSLSIEKYEIDNVGISKSYNLDFNEDDGLFSIYLSVDFIYKNPDKKLIKLFGVSIQTLFHFQNFEGIVKKVDENTIDIPDNLAVNLISIAFSTARGILFCLTAKSDYEGIYLPLTDPEEFHDILNKSE